MNAPEDWVESTETVAALRAAQQTGALMATERLALLSMGWQPPSMRQVCCILYILETIHDIETQCKCLSSNNRYVPCEGCEPLRLVLVCLSNHL